MNRNILLFLRFLFPLLLSSIVHADVTTYRASLQPTPSSTFQDLDGFVAIFTEPGTLSLGYAGIIEGVEGDLIAASCNATNGCGVHIHNGTSCSNTTTQGGHYYVISEDVTEDPWIDARYSSDADGKSNFQGLLNIGTTDIDGRVFLVHSENGTRIGCGVIEAVQYDDETQNLLNTNTLGLTDADVASTVTAYSVGNGVVCYFGSAINLEPGLTSYLNADSPGEFTSCNFTNGCGVHIHNGTACTNKTSQGGHLYNTELVPVDPWLYTMYHMTDIDGNAEFVGCVETGVEESFTNFPFIVHSDNGTRVSCGILKAMDGSALPPATTPVGPPAFAPSGSAAAESNLMTFLVLMSAMAATTWMVSDV